jgi:hypothetical protein
MRSPQDDREACRYDDEYEREDGCFSLQHLLLSNVPLRRGLLDVASAGWLGCFRDCSFEHNAFVRSLHEHGTVSAKALVLLVVCRLAQILFGVLNYDRLARNMNMVDVGGQVHRFPSDGYDHLLREIHRRHLEKGVIARMIIAFRVQRFHPR